MPKLKHRNIIDQDDFLNNSKKSKIQQEEYLEDNSTFGKFIKESGYIIRKGDQPHILNCDQSNFQKKLKKKLNSIKNYGGSDEKCNEFIKGLEEHLKDELNLKWALLYTQTNPNCETARKGHQDSLIRLLLNLDNIQPQIIGLLTEILFEVIYNDEAANESVDIPRLILTNLRWLDHIVSPEILTEKITELLQGSPEKMQMEIISFAPNIVNDNCHTKIAYVFIELFNTTPGLTPAILDSFPYLSLSHHDSDDIQHKVLKTLSGVKPPNIPIVLKFLLHNITPATASETLNEIREKVNLPGEMGSSSPTRSQRRNDLQKERQDLDVLLFSTIKWALLSLSFLSVAWLKVIDEVVEGKDIRPIDLLILIQLYELFPARRKTIESIIHNKIRRELKSEDLLQNTFCHHPSVLKQYFESVKKIACSFLRSTVLPFSQFGNLVYKYCFLYLDSYEQEVVLAILSHLGDNENVRNAALILLSHLSHNCTLKMSNHIILLKGSLDIIDMLSLREAKKLMDSIIHLANAKNSHSPLQDELTILISKQLSHPDLKYKRLGVLSAVLTIKTMFGLKDEDTDIEDDAPSVNSMREAESLFEMVHSSTAKSPPAAALFMDELASNILRSGLNSTLEKWISNKIINDFEEFYVTDTSTDLSGQNFPLPVEYQWNLEEMDDNPENEDIALNLATLAMSDNYKSSKRASIVMIAPHFRLMRMVESHLNEGNLESIDALLGCPVLAPKLSAFDDFSFLSEKQQHFAVDCIFYTVNWFRELINAFATQKEKGLKLKVSMRLRHVIELQSLLSTILPKVTSYKPPPAVFDCDFSQSVPAASGTGAKTQKKTGTKRNANGKKKAVNQEDKLISLSTQTQKSVMDAEFSQKESNYLTGNIEAASLIGYRAYLRELHLDVFNILFKKISFDEELDNKGLLTIKHVEFLLTDFNAKLTRAFQSGTKKAAIHHLGKSTVEKDIGFASLDLFSPKEIAGLSCRFLKPICVHLQSIACFIESLKENDGIIDGATIFIKCANITKVSTMLFTTINLFLNIPHLQKEDSISKDILKMLAKQLEEDVTQMSSEELISSAFRYVSNFKDTIMNINTASAIAQVLKALATLSTNSKEYEEQIVEIIESFLRQEWYSTNGVIENGANFNKQIAELLNILFNHTSSVKVVHSICLNGLQKMAQTDEELELATLNKGTLLVYYKCLLENLIKTTKKQLNKKSSNEKKLDIWQLSVKAFTILVGILKKFDSNLMLAPCLKYSKSYLELFLNVGMPLLDKSLHTDQQDVISIIKNLQSSTRFLQHVCTHSKVKQDVRLMKFVPLVKRALETIIYRVKAMLVFNKCSDAFWLGNLKNRDLRGEEILTQVIKVKNFSCND